MENEIFHKYITKEGSAKRLILLLAPVLVFVFSLFLFNKLIHLNQQIAATDTTPTILGISSDD